jgi:2-iminobutanoate/2-iminopropanoate deaminase
MRREVIAPKDGGLDAARSLNLPVSAAIRAGEFVFVSGLVATDPATGERMLGTVAAQTRQILTALAAVLEAAGSSLEKVVKVNVLIYSMLEYNNMNEVYREFFATNPPARTVCGAKLNGGSKVEIDCVALA